MGKTEGVPCNNNAVSRVTQSAIVTPVKGARSGVKFSRNAFSNFSRFLENRWGLSRMEKAAVYGSMIGAPLAVIGAPLLGAGVAVGLAAPAIITCFKRRSQRQKEARAKIYEATEPVAEEAEKEVNESDRVAQLENTVNRQGQALQALLNLIKEDQATRQQTVQDAVDEFMRSQSGDAQADVSPKGEQKAAAEKPTGSSEVKVKPNGKVKVNAFEAKTGTIENVITFEPKTGAEVLDGNRNVFFLTGVSKVKPGSESVMYSKKPLTQIPGTIGVGDVISGTPADLWDAVGESSGMDKKQFMREARKVKRNGSQVSVVTVREVNRFEMPISLADSGLTKHDLLGSVTLKPDKKEAHKDFLAMIKNRNVVKPASEGTSPKEDKSSPDAREEQIPHPAETVEGVFSLDELEASISS